MIESRTVFVTGPLAACAAEVEDRLAALGYAQSTRSGYAPACSSWPRKIGWLGTVPKQRGGASQRAPHSPHIAVH